MTTTPGILLDHGAWHGPWCWENFVGHLTRRTDAVTTVTSEKLRDVTWVIVNTVKSGSCGAGGNVLGVEDVRRITRGR